MGPDRAMAVRSVTPIRPVRYIRRRGTSTGKPARMLSGAVTLTVRIGQQTDTAQREPTGGMGMVGVVHEVKADKRAASTDIITSQNPSLSIPALLLFHL